MEGLLKAEGLSVVGVCVEEEKQPFGELTVRGDEEKNKGGKSLVGLSQRHDSRFSVCFDEVTGVANDRFDALCGAMQEGEQKGEVEGERTEEEKELLKRWRLAAQRVQGIQSGEPPARGEEGEGGGENCAALLEGEKEKTVERRRLSSGERAV